MSETKSLYPPKIPEIIKRDSCLDPSLVGWRQMAVSHDQIMLCDWYWVRTDRGCGGVGVIDGVVRAACPYFRFMIGKRLTEIPQIRERHRI